MIPQQVGERDLTLMNTLPLFFNCGYVAMNKGKSTCQFPLVPLALLGTRRVSLTRLVIVDRPLLLRARVKEPNEKYQ